MTTSLILPRNLLVRAEMAVWLRNAAVRLTAQGESDLASEALAEAAELDRPPAPLAAVVHRCDSCRAVVRSAKRLDRYGNAGIDWVLCAKCEKAAWL